MTDATDETNENGETEISQLPDSTVKILVDPWPMRSEHETQTVSRT